MSNSLGDEERRVLIACIDDGTIVGQGMCAMLRAIGRFDVVDQLDDRADLTVLRLDDDAEGQLVRVVELSAAAPLLVVGPVDLAADALKAGAAGYATPATRVDDFLRVIDGTLDGRRAISVEATEFLIGQSGERLLQGQDLSPRQLEILRHLVSGEPVGSIATLLGVSRQAVGQALERLRRRARVESNRALVKFVRDHRLLDGH